MLRSVLKNKLIQGLKLTFFLVATWFPKYFKVVANFKIGRQFVQKFKLKM